MRIATKDEYEKRGDTTQVKADLSKGILDLTYVQVADREWEKAKPFAQGYWAGLGAANCGMGPEQFSKSQAFTETEEKDILEERQGTHGEFKDVAPISQTLKIYFRAQSTWDALTLVQQEALDNIAQKIARIFAGDPNFPDHWIDIQGYAKLAQQEIEKNGNRPSSPSEEV